jgi:hypothetical protein
MSLVYTIIGWILVLMAFFAGIRGVRQSITCPGRQKTARRALMFCLSLCFLLAASAIIASAVVKIAVR